MTFAGHDAGPRGAAIENDFLSTLVRNEKSACGK